MIASIKEWQEGLSGIATIAAGALAYIAVMRQIKSDRRLTNAQFKFEHEMAENDKKNRELAFLTVLESSLSSYILSLAEIDSDVSEISSMLNRGPDLRDRIAIIGESTTFEISLIGNWEAYTSFPIPLIRKLRNFHDAYLHQMRMLESLSIHIKPELPLLRAVNESDIETGTPFAMIGSLRAAMSVTRECGQDLLSDVQRRIPE